ncbi:Probable cytoplasmic aconitate hydratase [Eumeta japonica]|uniref:Probable cytoplasmic aconitate hydratase n=1 Tax=Eumeta variegata TaxID=151549 RepID=A0A4C1WIP8_EUMVA|nr:Probable cytoplasmic aconitate hydratase [Eumeta japonica]
MANQKVHLSAHSPVRGWRARAPWALIGEQGIGSGPMIAESFERIHRSNLVGMGIVPLQFQEGVTADTLGLQGDELFNIHIPDDLKPGQMIDVEVVDGAKFQVKLRFDTEVDLTYFKHGGILNYMVRRMLEM